MKLSAVPLSDFDELSRVAGRAIQVKANKLIPEKFP
jgi:hypothetical protein